MARLMPHRLRWSIVHSARKAALSALVLSILLILTVPAPASAEWSGSATLDNGPLRVNFMEELKVTVTNDGPGPMEVTAVSVTVIWHMPTYFQVFEGSATLAPGESRTFISEPYRMPTTDPDSYPVQISVTARGADGIAQEKHFTDTQDIYVFGINVAGMPEEMFVPLAVAGGMLLITLLLFRFERAPGWPPLRSVPRWRRRS